MPLASQLPCTPRQANQCLPAKTARTAKAGCPAGWDIAMPTGADNIVATLKASGVRRIYGLPGDSLNGFTDALRRSGDIAWEHVRPEEAAAFAAAAEAAITG